jgi:hypothetical protein
MWVRNVLKTYKAEAMAMVETPIVDSTFVSTITSLPYEQRLYKRVQKAILRKYFPELYKIPYAMAGLPPFLHHRIHGYAYRATQTLFPFIRNPRPLQTADAQWFLRSNLPLFQKILLSNVPPFMTKEFVQKLIYRVQVSGSDIDASMLVKLVTYALLSSQLNS